MILFYISISITCISFLLEVYFSFRFLRKLKRKFPALWRDLDQPAFYFQGMLIGAWDLKQYLLKKTYLSRENQNEIRFCENYRSLMLLGYFSTILFLLISVVALSAVVLVFKK